MHDMVRYDDAVSMCIDASVHMTLDLTERRCAPANESASMANATRCAPDASRKTGRSAASFCRHVESSSAHVSSRQSRSLHCDLTWSLVRRNCQAITLRVSTSSKPLERKKLCVSLASPSGFISPLAGGNRKLQAAASKVVFSKWYRINKKLLL